MAFYDRLKEARIASGLTQKQLAEKLGIAGTTITGYEKGKSEPNLNTIGKIMEILHVDANFLWQDEMRELNTDDFSIPEIKMVRKYRVLDEHGKDMVDTVLEKEYTRSIALKATEPVQSSSEETYNIDKAARGQKPLELTKEQMKEFGDSADAAPNRARDKKLF